MGIFTQKVLKCLTTMLVRTTIRLGLVEEEGEVVGVTNVPLVAQVVMVVMVVTVVPLECLVCPEATSTLGTLVSYRFLEMDGLGIGMVVEVPQVLLEEPT